MFYLKLLSAVLIK